MRTKDVIQTRKSTTSVEFYEFYEFDLIPKHEETETETEREKEKVHTSIILLL